MKVDESMLARLRQKGRSSARDSEIECRDSFARSSGQKSGFISQLTQGGRKSGFGSK